MLFTNPSIIYSPNDAIIGAVECKKDEVSYLEYMALVKKRLLGLIIDGVKENMSENLHHEHAVREVAHAVDNYLSFNQSGLIYANNENEIAEKLFKSDEFIFWETSIHYRFMNLHKDVITEKTPIKVGGMNDAFEDMGIEDADYWDVLQSLSSVTTIQP